MNTEHLEPITVDLAPSVVPEQKQAPGEHVGPLRPWRRQDVCYLLLLTGLVVGMAWRYTPSITSEVAGEWWDPLLNIWALSWNTTTLLHNPAHFWQAQLLYPNPLTLSYSENLLGETLFYAPVFLITHNPVLSYNIVFYLSILLCGTNMYLLARYFTGSPLAAFFAALTYAFAPYRIGQIDHIHVIAGEWIPLAFLYLDRSLKTGTWRHWILFALFYLLQLLSSIYYGIFLSYALLAYIPIRYTWPLVKSFRQPKQAFFRLLLASVKPAIVLGIVLVIVNQFMAPYTLSLKDGMVRLIDQTEGFSAFVRDFGFTAPFNWLYGTRTYNGMTLPYDSEHYLFFGWTTLVIAGLGTILAFRRRHITTLAFTGMGLIILLFTFGPFLQFSTSSGAPLVSGPYHPGARPFPPAFPMPWLFAYFRLPGFNGLRVPARLVGVLLVTLALLAAYGVKWLQEITQHSTLTDRHRLGYETRKRFLTGASLRTQALRLVLFLIPLAFLLEAIPAYLPVTHVPTGNAVPTVYRWLATHDGNAPIVELPIAYLDEQFVTKDEAWYDYYAVYHPHPIVNGWSGYRPYLTTQIAGALQTFPAEASLALLKKYHIRYVVLHLQLYSPGTAATLSRETWASASLRRVAAFDSDSVWQVI